MHRLPIGTVPQRSRVCFELTLGRTDQVAGAARAQPLQIGFADQTPIQHPQASRLSILLLHQTHDLLKRGDIVAVAGEHFIGDRQPFGRNHQSNAHLFAIRPVIATVAAGRFEIFLRQSFDVGAGDIVEQELEANAKPVPIARQQMFAERILLRQQCVQSAIKPGVVDF